MQPLFSQLDVSSLTHRLDFVRPSEVRRIQNANITEIGSITTHTPSDLQKKTGLTLDFCARLITACDRLVHNQKQQQQQQNGNSSSFQSLASVLNQRRNFGTENKNENNENNNSSSTSSPLLDLPWHFSRCRSTGIEEIDQNLLVGGGFPHGQISEIFGLPGCGKTQLTMLIAATCTALPASSKSSSEKQGLPKISLGQNQSMMTMNNNNSNSNIISPPILVIDTEGSWSNERVLTFCETYYSSSSMLMKNQSKENKNETDKNEDDAAVEADDETPSNSTDFNPSEALHRIQFIRSTDLATVTSALLLFRQRIHHHVKILTREMVRRHQHHQQQTQDNNNSTSSSTSDKQHSIEEIMKHKIAQERELFERYEQKIRANYGGVLIIDSIAALLKENRIDDNFLHQTSLMGTTTGGSAAGGASGSGVSNIVKTQTIAAFSRLIQSITNETNTATIITNQMVKKRQQQQQQSSSSSNTSQQQIYNNYYVPALGEIWSSIPSIRCSIKKVPGAHFTSPMRIFSMIRGGSLLLLLSTMNNKNNQINDENDTLVGDEDDGRNEEDDLLVSQKQSVSTSKTSCQFIIDADFLRSPSSKTNNDNNDNNETIVTTITAHHEAKRRERKVDNNGDDGSSVVPPTININHQQTSSQQSSFAIPEPPVTTTTSTTTNEQPAFVQNPTTKKATSWFAKRR